MHLPRPEQGHTGDAELPSCGSVFARVKGSVGGSVQHHSCPWYMFGFSPAVGGSAPVLSDMEQLPGWAELLGERKVMCPCSPEIGYPALPAPWEPYSGAVPLPLALLLLWGPPAWGKAPSQYGTQVLEAPWPCCGLGILGSLGTVCGAGRLCWK